MTTNIRGIKNYNKKQTNKIIHSIVWCGLGQERLIVISWSLALSGGSLF